METLCLLGVKANAEKLIYLQLPKQTRNLRSVHRRYTEISEWWQVEARNPTQAPDLQSDPFGRFGTCLALLAVVKE